MRIKSLIEGVEKIVHPSGEYPADKEGLFEVPAEVGKELVNFPHWAQYLGEDVTAEAAKLEGDAHAALEAAKSRIIELEAEIAKLTAKVDAKPAKAAAAKKAAPAAADAKPAADAPAEGDKPSA